MKDQILNASTLWTHYSPDLDALLSLALAKRAGHKGEVKLLPAAKWNNNINTGEVGLDVGDPSINGPQKTESGGIAFKGDDGRCAAAALAKVLLCQKEYRATIALWDAVNAADHGEEVEGLSFVKGASTNQGLKALDWLGAWLEAVIEDCLDKEKAQADSKKITYRQVGTYKVAICPLGCHPAAPLQKDVDIKAWAATLPRGEFLAGLSTIKGGKEPHLGKMCNWKSVDDRLFSHPAGFMVGVSGKSPAKGNALDAKALQKSLLERFCEVAQLPHRSER